MITANWSEVAAVFDAVVDLDKSEREAYLSRICAGNSRLRDDVDAMLAADADAAGFLSGPILGRRLPLSVEFCPGDRVGPYEVIDLIGRGGMGAVYRARRVEDFDRLVAIKVIDRLLPDRATFRRFLRERQILSTLDHPNIARLFDGGVSDSGMPFLVMEYVDGVPIDDYCREADLPLRERLELFLGACLAVAHAHRLLIVHRDLKPANILVTEAGGVKLLDFGIARQLPGECQAATITGSNEILATPSFACPEQLSGAKISTSWDVYALGKILGLIVPETGRYSGETLSIRRIPIQQGLRMRESRLDLSSIVGKATCVQPSDRYESVGGLILDIQAVVDRRSVSARRMTKPDALISTVRRNLLGILGSAILLAVLSLLIFSFIQTRNEANDRLIVADGLSTYLLSVFEVIDPETRVGNSISAREVLDQGRNQARAKLPTDSPEYIRIIREIGGLYSKIGAYRQAQNLLSEVLLSSVKMDHLFVAGTHFELGRVLHIDGANDEAEIHFLNGLAIIEDAHEETSELFSDILEEMSLLAVDENRLQRADSLADACLETRKEWFGEGSPEVASALRLKARIRWRARDFETAERIYRVALTTELTKLGPTSLRVASTMNDLGLVYVDMAEFDRAETLLSEALRIKESALGASHPSYATSLVNLAPVVRDRFGADSAETVMRQATSIFVRSFGGNHHEVANAKNNLALYLTEIGKMEEAEMEYREALSIWQDATGKLHPDYLAGSQNLAILLRRSGKYQEALEYYQQAVWGFRQLGQNYRITLAGALNGLGKSYVGAGELGAAAASFRESLTIREKELPPGHWRIGTAKSLLGETLGLLGEYEEAESLLKSGLEILRASRGPDDSKTVEAEARLQNAVSGQLAKAS